MKKINWKWIISRTIVTAILLCIWWYIEMLMWK